MNVAQIRQKFLDFFVSKGHTIVRSSSLVPHNDPTLLFTNSGMVQFKDVFLGKEQRGYKRAVSVQACLRAGGKHNDLENVGYTARHHTFFEMLGNWSFGDYFKHDALLWAWELLTKVYGLPADKLWATVYQDDDEAYDIWTKVIGLPAERVVRIGDNKGARYASDNFWMMADTGPCGPCSEIFYDHGPDVWGGPPGSPDADGDRYIEIWNNVFMQFDMQADGSLQKLPAPCVDTGMGLERIAAVLQHVHSNYEIDLFARLIQAVAKVTQCRNIEDKSLRVIADHLRACSFLIVDGVIPGNEGRGYVLRRIIRRAIRHGYKLGMSKPFFNTLVPSLVTEMGGAYPDLVAQKDKVQTILCVEEERFFETLEIGMEILNTALTGESKVFDGKLAFKLHDTYGFPLDLTADVCRERGIEVNVAAFDAAMAQQKNQARAAGKFKSSGGLEFEGALTEFKGYTELEVAQTSVLALYRDGVRVRSIEAGEDAVVVLAVTPFYAESGGQVGDAGVLVGSNEVLFTVTDTQKIQSQVFGHHGRLHTGQLREGAMLKAQVNVARRQTIMRHHSATHLMHYFLQQVLGAHVQQKGSLVDDQRTRFDFVHHSAMTSLEIRAIEDGVNQAILANQASSAAIMSFDDAIKSGAMALFGEKYGDDVRVLEIGPSRELCGGTHISRTGDIGIFKIVSESGVAAGIRRIEAVCGAAALQCWRELDQTVGTVCAALKATPSELESRVAQMQAQQRQLEIQLQGAQDSLAHFAAQKLLQSAQTINAARVIVHQLPQGDSKELRRLYDQLKPLLLDGIIVLACIEMDKVSVLVGVGADLITRNGQFHAGKLLQHILAPIDGKGGGRADMAQGGGSNIGALSKALDGVSMWVRAIE